MIALTAVEMHTKGEKMKRNEREMKAMPISNANGKSHFTSSRWLGHPTSFEF
jgi:hypothetical protein